ncbi:MAG: hypothetical protein A3I68_06260 [Candidatus Melainabacteria bacterium RIFCSPLOWO2_02_FULL_35_15]|nr:MAG: hypothetical protein A3I68_06260 [Candidatus Melainabacteria bacterium RIFCSPLOWO2_02_FULL_35_15]
MARLEFLFRVIKEYIQKVDSSCPHCKCHKTELIGTKYFVLKLLRCSQCELMFRYPKDNENTNLKYYEHFYNEIGITSNIPSESSLQQLLQTTFCETDKDFAEKIQILKKFKQSGDILDFGCSWGYGTWQIQRAGFNTIGFEISKQRASFGRANLGLKILDSFTDLIPYKDSFDVIFTNHALEHMPNLFSIFEIFHNLLKGGGVLILFVPNCSGIDNKKNFNFKKSYAFGEKHTFAFERTFFEVNLPKYGFKVQCTSSPYNPDKLFYNNKNNNDKEYSELFVLGEKIKYYESNS